MPQRGGGDAWKFLFTPFCTGLCANHKQTGRGLPSEMCSLPPLPPSSILSFPSLPPTFPWPCPHSCFPLSHLSPSSVGSDPSHTPSLVLGFPQALLPHCTSHLPELANSFSLVPGPSHPPRGRSDFFATFSFLLTRELPQGPQLASAPCLCYTRGCATPATHHCLCVLRWNPGLETRDSLCQLGTSRLSESARGWTRNKAPIYRLWRRGQTGPALRPGPCNT